MQVDELDLDILSILLRTANLPKAEIARRLGVATSTVSERVRRLEEGGVVQRYEARLDPRTLGFRTLAFVFVAERKPTGDVDTAARLAEVTGVEEVHKIAGDDCFLVKIRARDTDDLGQVLDTEVNAIPTVAGTRTTIVLRTVLEDVALGGFEGVGGALEP